MKMKRRHWIGFLAGLLLAIWMGGCSQKEEEMANLEFTVVEEERLPEELLEIIEEKKAESFKMTFADGGYMYLCVGYGKQQTGGYSIAVNKLGTTENAVLLDTDLIGPQYADDKNAAPSYPYIVVKTPFVDKTVVFE